MKVYKISIIGAGNVGATTAIKLVDKNIAEIALIDVAENITKGKTIDIGQAGVISGYSHSMSCGQDYSLIKGSDIVVITAGLARKPGMSRDDLLRNNANIVEQVCTQIKQYASSAIVIVVTNPMDVMTYVAYKALGFEKHRVIGMGGVLDTARYVYFLAQKLKVPSGQIEGYVAGEHGDSMVPLVSMTKVKGVALKQVLSETEIQEVIEHTKTGGAQIVSLLGFGSAYVAPAAAIVAMIESIVHDQKKVFPCATFLCSYYCAEQIPLGVPVVLGKKGIEKEVCFSLSEEEKKAFEISSQKVYEQIQKIPNVLHG